MQQRRQVWRFMRVYGTDVFQRGQGAELRQADDHTGKKNNQL